MRLAVSSAGGPDGGDGYGVELRAEGAGLVAAVDDNSAAELVAEAVAQGAEAAKAVAQVDVDVAGVCPSFGLTPCLADKRSNRGFGAKSTLAARAHWALFSPLPPPPVTTGAGSKGVRPEIGLL